METQQKDHSAIMVFETNIKLKKDLPKIAGLIKTEVRITKWNIDQHDIDNVLRIESHNLHPTEVIELIKKAGYYCVELKD